MLCGDFNCPRAERDGRVYTWAERDDTRLIPDRGLRWDAAERAVILGLAAFDVHDVYRADARLGGASVGEKGSHVTRGTTVERRYDHVFASEGLRPWAFAYRHDVREGKGALSDHSAALVEFRSLGPSAARVEAYDDAMARALERAAQRIERDPARPSLREELIENAVLETWPPATGGGEVRRRVSLPIPDWEPQPKDTDLAGALSSEAFPGFAAEVKVDDLDQTLWDLFKLLSAARGTPSIGRCYLIVAGYPSRWTNVEVSEVFDCREGARVWEARAMFSRWQKAWRNLLGGGRARPRRVQAQVRVTPIWRGHIDAFESEGYELRCVAVEAVTYAGWLEFAGDWPVPTSM